MNSTVYQDLKLVRQDEHIETAEFDGEWMLMNVETHAMTKLNDLGGMIWSIIPECPTIEQLVVRVADEYAMPADVVLRDIEHFIGEMLSVGLLSVA